MKTLIAAGLSVTMILSMAACGTTASGDTVEGTEDSTVTEQITVEENTQDSTSAETTFNTNGAIDTSDIFTDRDLKQEADLSEAKYITVEDGQDIEITEEGVYVLSGTAANVTVTVDTADDAKVQIVLDGVNITNETDPAIYVKNADKVFVTTTDSENSLKVTGTFQDDGDTNLDAVIFSKDDLVLNGTGTLNIESTANGVTSKDDLKITGGTINVTSAEDAFEANDSIAAADGNITINTQKDGFHAENDEDNTVGYIYIAGGTFKIAAADDGIQGTTIVQIDGGTFDIDAAEAIEGTVVQINDGTIDIQSSDDGINGSQKSTAFSVKVEINGGDITISMGQGDTDAIDVNGDLEITGGNVNISAQSPFDVDGNISFTGGTVIENGQEVTELTNQMMGGMMGGGPGNFNGGQRGGFPGSDQNGQSENGGSDNSQQGGFGGPGMGGHGGQPSQGGFGGPQGGIDFGEQDGSEDSGQQI